MELATIEMDQQKAKEAFEAYRAAVRERHDAEDEQIMRGYKALSKGKQLIRLSETLAAAGTVELSYRRRSWNQRLGRSVWGPASYTVPKLAVARAHVKEAWTFGVQQNGSCEIRSKREVHYNNRYDLHRFPTGTFESDEQRTESTSWRPEIRAMVPLVPPPLRPKDKLSNYLILWEADWSVVTPPAPKDPALLKRVGGDLYAVCAVWDLTEVERAVLALR